MIGKLLLLILLGALSACVQTNSATGASGSPIINPLPLVSGNGVMANGQNTIANPTGQVNYPLGLKTPGLSVDGAGNISQWPHNITFTDASNSQLSTNSALFWQGSVTGTCHLLNAPFCAVYSMTANSFNVTRNGSAASMFAVNGNVGGAQQTGTVLWSTFNMNVNGGSADVVTPGQPVNYVTLTATGTSNHPVGNSSPGIGNTLGDLFATNLTCHLLSGATNWSFCSGGEVDISVAAGASVGFLTGLQIVLLPDHNTASVVTEADGLLLSSASLQPGFDYGIDFSGYNGVSPMKSTGTLIGCLPHFGTGQCRNNLTGDDGTVANGVDFSLFKFTGSAFKSPGFSVGPTGIATTFGVGITKTFNYAGGDNSLANSFIYAPSEAVSGACVNVTGSGCIYHYLAVSDSSDASSNGVATRNMLLEDDLQTAKGSRIGLSSKIIVRQTPADNTATNRNYQAGEFYVGANFTAPATGTTNLFSMGNYNIVTAAGWNSQVGFEQDMVCGSPCNTPKLTGIDVVLLGTNNVTPSNFFYGFGVASAANAISTMSVAFSIGGYDGWMPIASNGWIMRCYPHTNTGPCADYAGNSTIAHGIDLSDLTFSSDAFKSTGFVVDGAGNVTTNTNKTAGFTVSGLPAAGTAGRRAYVTDQLTSCPAVGGALTGGGAIKCPAFDNGTAWVSG